HFSQMFRKSTGESPHQFVLRHRVERAREMLCTADARVLDVAVACGFKTQQHFARVFRRLCGASPTEYRQEFLCRGEPSALETRLNSAPFFASTGNSGRPADACVLVVDESCPTPGAVGPQVIDSKLTYLG